MEKVIFNKKYLKNLFKNGLKRGSINIIAGESGTGKSMIMKEMSKGLSNNYNVLYFNTDYRQDMNLDYELIDITRIEELYNFLKNKENCKKYDFIFIDSFTNLFLEYYSAKELPTLMRLILEEMRRIKRKYNVTFICSTYLQWIREKGIDYIKGGKPIYYYSDLIIHLKINADIKEKKKTNSRLIKVGKQIKISIAKSSKEYVAEKMYLIYEEDKTFFYVGDIEFNKNNLYLDYFPYLKRERRRKNELYK